MVFYQLTKLLKNTSNIAMINKYSIVILIVFFFNNTVYSTSKSSSSSGPKSDGRQDSSYLKVKNSNYQKGLNSLKQAKRYKKKNKEDKAKKRFNDSIKFLLLANKESPNNPSVLKYLGFSFAEYGDFMMAEIYYKEGLDIEPKHIEINEYLGKLYLQTNRINKSKERLRVLEYCKCKEFISLKKLISQF